MKIEDFQSKCRYSEQIFYARFEYHENFIYFHNIYFFNFFRKYFTEAYEVAVPKWLKGEVLEVCTVNQDVKINQRWEENNGAWIKGNQFLKEGVY